MRSRSRFAGSGRVGICGVMTVAVGAVGWALSGRIAAQSPPTAVGFTAEQADKGRDAYTEHCASCHGPNLDDGAFAPPLSGADFRQRWGARSPEALFTQ